MIEKYIMSDFVRRATGQDYFMLAMTRNENASQGSYKNFGIYYMPEPEGEIISPWDRLKTNFFSDTSLKKRFKPTGGQTLRDEAFRWCFKVIFEKGIELTNDSYSVKQLLKMIK